MLKYLRNTGRSLGALEIKVLELRLGGGLSCLRCGLRLGDFISRKAYACPGCRDCFRHEEAFDALPGLKEALDQADIKRGFHV